MNTPNDGGPAFPMQGWNQMPDGSVNVIQDLRGMSLRDYFAAAALQGMAASDYWSANFDAQDTPSLKAAVEVAFAAADAMLAAREKKQ